MIAAAACMLLVALGSAVQVAVGAGLSVVCGPFVLLWLGPVAVPVLLCLNLLVSIVATVFGTAGVRWGSAASAAVATVLGCAVAAALPSLPDWALRATTAAVLLVVALPRPGTSAKAGSAARVGIALAGLVTGVLTVWTATPGPLLAVAMARGGWSGEEVRRTMQPVSVVGYAAGLAAAGLPPPGAPGLPLLSALVAATLVGTGAGLVLRPRLAPARVVLLIRVVAAAAAMLLILSLVR